MIEEVAVFVIDHPVESALHQGTGIFPALTKNCDTIPCMEVSGSLHLGGDTAIR
jgi:hypothetical protein